MILNFYGLREQPFGVTPDPAYLYPSHTHCEALDSLTDAILTDRGFLALIAEPGMGKTTLLNQVLEGLRDTARAVFLFQTQCNSREFFQYLMNELGVDFTGMGLVAMHKKLNEILFAEMLAGRRFVLIVDEAQNLDESVLETIRLLSNFETTHSKLMQIILAGQPQLAEKLKQKQLAQLLQRLTLVQYLEPLSPDEAPGYIKHRLKVAGYQGESLFDPAALAIIAEQSRGIPREINKICFRALLEGYAAGSQILTSDLVEKAIGRFRLAASSHPQPIPPPIPVAEQPPASASPKVVAMPAGAGLSYPGTTGPRLPTRGIWIGSVLAMLLSGSLLLPHNSVQRVAGLTRETLSETKNLVQHEIADIARATPVLSKSQVVPQAAAANASEPIPLGVTPIEASTIGNAALMPDPFRLVIGAPPAPAAKGGGQFSLAHELGLKVNRIAIDPGHGGYDTGTMGPHGLLEKDVCLDVALRLGQLIKQNLPGTDVVYTRRDDRHVPLEERAAIANDANADLFISVHANSSDMREIRGAETFYLSLADSRESRELASRENASSESSLHSLPELIQKIARNEKAMESRQLAVDIQQALSNQLQMVSRQEANRGVKQAPFIVLTGANMPAVLSEISFVSNATDENLLLESSQRQRIAEGLFRGIAAYLGKMPGPLQVKQKIVSENKAVATVGSQPR